jgi:16S rRNA processing protein RimM
VSRAHGVRGEVRIVCHNPASTALLRAAEIVIGGRRLHIDDVRPVDGAFLVALSGVADRDAAEALKGQTVAVDRAAVDVPPGEVLLADLVGCRAVRRDGTPMGEVIDVEVGAQDRLVIADGDQAWQLPMVPAFVIAVDLEAKVITVDPPEGLPSEPVTRG